MDWTDYGRVHKLLDSGNSFDAIGCENECGHWLYKAVKSKILVSSRFVPFESVDLSSLMQETDYDLAFENEAARLHYVSLIECRCTRCPQVFHTMSALNRHSNEHHQLSYCDLCLRHASLLPHEFTPMNQKELVAHRSDKKRGHPLCEFCSTRLYEFEDLLTHIRQKHFFCDICQRQGQRTAFQSQGELMGHYQTEHYRCEECQLSDVTNVFENEIDLKAHRLREHAAGRQRADLREENLLPINVVYRSSGGVGDSRSGRSNMPERRNFGGRGGGRGGASRDYEDEERVVEEIAQAYEENPDDFPTLGGNTSAFSREQARQRKAPAPTSTHKTPIQKPSKPKPAPPQQTWNLTSGPVPRPEEFPTLGGGATSSTGQSKSSSIWQKKSSNSVQQQQSSEHFYHNPPPSFQPSVNNQFRQLSLVNDFPELPSGSDGISNRRSPTWCLNVPASSSVYTAPKITNNELNSNIETKSKKKKKNKKKKAGVNPFKMDESSDSENNCRSEPPVTPPPRREERWEPVRNGSSSDFPSLPQPLEPVNNFSVLYNSPIEPSTVPVNQLSLVGDHNRFESQRASQRHAPKIASQAEFPTLGSASSGTNIHFKQAGKKSKQRSSKQPVERQSVSANPRETISLRDIASSLVKATFIPPKDFETRNNGLIESMQIEMGDQFSQFIALAGQYRKRIIDPCEFVRGANKIMKVNIQIRCIPELVALLPDIGLQRSLFDELPAVVKKELSECLDCGQVCTKGDLRNHSLQVHS